TTGSALGVARRVGRGTGPDAARAGADRAARALRRAGVPGPARGRAPAGVRGASGTGLRSRAAILLSRGSRPGLAPGARARWFAGGAVRAGGCDSTERGPRLLPSGQLSRRKNPDRTAAAGGGVGLSRVPVT